MWLYTNYWGERERENQANLLNFGIEILNNFIIRLDSKCYSVPIRAGETNRDSYLLTGLLAIQIVNC